jgi:hypothetical protein
MLAMDNEPGDPSPTTARNIRWGSGLAREALVTTSKAVAIKRIEIGLLIYSYSKTRLQCQAQCSKWLFRATFLSQAESPAGLLDLIKFFTCVKGNTGLTDQANYATLVAS